MFQPNNWSVFDILSNNWFDWFVSPLWIKVVWIDQAKEGSWQPVIRTGPSFVSTLGPEWGTGVYKVICTPKSPLKLMTRANKKLE